MRWLSTEVNKNTLAFNKPHQHPKNMNKILTICLALALSFFSANAQSLLTTMTDWVDKNTATGNNFTGSKTANGIVLSFGQGITPNNFDAYGTSTSHFGFPNNAFFDGQQLKFGGGNANQNKIDFRIANNSGVAQKFVAVEFDFRVNPSLGNPTSYSIVHVNNGDSTLIKGASVETGTAMNNLAGIASGDLDSGINSYNSAIGAAISGTAWIADGGYANFRLILSSGNFNNVSQLDDFGVYLTAAAVPEPSSYALLAGLFVCSYMMVRRRAVS